MPASKMDDMEGTNILAPNTDGGEALPAHLDLHAGLPTQIGLMSSREEFKNPFTSIDRTDKIEFNISCSKDEVIDPYNTMIVTESVILLANGSPIPLKTGPNDALVPNVTSSQVCFVNGLSSAWFKNCAVRLNNTLISPGDGLYMYKGDMENRLFNSRAAKSNMKISGYYEDEIKYDDETDAKKAFHTPGCAPSLKVRYEEGKFGRRYQCMGKIHSEIFDQTKLLPPDTSLDVVFTKNDNSNFLILSSDGAEYKVKLVSCRLLVRYVKVDPDILNEMDLITSRGKNMIFPVRKVQMSFYTKVQANADFSEQNIIKEGTPLPRRIFVAFVRQEAFHGSKGMDPFNYQHCSIENVTLRVGGQIRPYTELKCKTEGNNPDVLLPFTAMQKSTNTFLNERDNGLDKNNFLNGNFIVGYDLTTSGALAGVAYELPCKDSVQLDIKLTTARTHPFTMIVYAEYDIELEIDKNNNVYSY